MSDFYIKEAEKSEQIREGIDRVISTIDNWFKGRGNMERWEWVKLKKRIKSPQTGEKVE